MKVLPGFGSHLVAMSGVPCVCSVAVSFYIFSHIFYAYRDFLGCSAARSKERLLEFGMGTLGQRHLREFIWCGFFWSCEHEWSDSWGLAHACNLVVWLVRVEGFWQHSFLFTKNSILPHISCMWIFANFGGSSDY